MKSDYPLEVITKAMVSGIGRVLAFCAVVMGGSWAGNAGAGLLRSSEGALVFDFSELGAHPVAALFRMGENFLYPAGFVYLAGMLAGFILTIRRLWPVVVLPLIFLVQMWDTFLLERTRDLNGWQKELVTYDYSVWGYVVLFAVTLGIGAVLVTVYTKKPSLLGE